MAKLIFKSGNQGIWGYQQTYKYEVTGATPVNDTVTRITAEYNADEWGAPSAHPEKLTFDVKNLTVDSEGNPDGGIIVSAKWFLDGKAVIIGKGLDFDISTVAGEELYWSQLTADGLTMIGSDDSEADDWDGDDMSTGPGNDVVRANGGDDYISDNGGKDKYFGGEGFDTVAYTYADSRIVANFAKGFVKQGGFKDKIDGIEALRGTEFNDRVTGDSNDNRFQGFAGNDYFNGGAGTDQIRYHREDRLGGTEGIVANMAKGKIKDTFGDTDTIKNVERVRGSQFDDKILDAKGDNGYEGEAGDDTFVFKGGNDWANGGAGADTFVFAGNFGWDYIEDFDATEGDLLKIKGASSFSDLELGENSKGNAIIEYNGNTVELNGYSQGDVDNSWFAF